MSNINGNMLDSVEVKREVTLDNTFLLENEHSAPVGNSIDSMVDDYSNFKIKKEYEYIDFNELNTNCLKQVNTSHDNVKCKEEISDDSHSEICIKFETENQQNVEFEFSENSESDEKIDISKIILQSSQYNDNKLKLESENDSENQNRAFTQKQSPDDDPLKQCNKKKHLAKRKNCQFCNKSFKLKNSLDDHLLKQHKNKIESDIKKFITHKVHTCEICSYVTTSTRLLIKHISKHTKQKTSKICKFCNKSYNTKRALDDHMLKQHKQEIKGDLKSLITSKIYKCVMCSSYETTNKVNIDRHVNSLHNEVKIKMKCQFCAESFICKQSLYRHFLRKHKDKVKNNITSLITSKFYVCKICNSYETTEKWSLDQHINLVHNEVKHITKCQFCTKSFIRKQSLDEHILRMHRDKIKNDIPSFITSKISICKICNSFETTKKSHLDRHIKLVHNEKL